MIDRAKLLASKRAYYYRHKARILAEQKENWEANREELCAQRRARYAEQREKRQAAARERYASDPDHAERVRAHSRKYRAARLAEYRERDRRYAKAYQLRDRKRFLAKMFRSNNKRKATKLAAFIEPVDAAVVFRRDKAVCGICGLKVDPDSKWHIDHVIPLSKGGLHSYDNVQLAHAHCNLSKRDVLPLGQFGLFQKAVIA